MIAYPTNIDPNDWAPLWKIAIGDFSEAVLSARALYDLQGYVMSRFVSGCYPSVPIIGANEPYDPKQHIEAMVKYNKMFVGNVDWEKLLVYLAQLLILLTPHLPKPNVAHV